MSGSGSFQGQMAIAVIGGLVTSTGLTLVMVPAMFTWIDDLERWLGRRIGRRLFADAGVPVDSPTPPKPSAPPAAAPGVMP
jgi:hypothetical protein